MPGDRGEAGREVVVAAPVRAARGGGRPEARSGPQLEANLAVVVVVGLRNHDEGAIATQSATRRSACAASDARAGSMSLARDSAIAFQQPRPPSLPLSARGACPGRRMLVMFLTACQSLWPVSRKHLRLAIFVRRKPQSSLTDPRLDPGQRDRIVCLSVEKSWLASWLSADSRGNGRTAQGTRAEEVPEPERPDE